VGAVLLQWQENEDNPRPVAFVSRKLSGAQYRYDARNVEALAAQKALTTWRTLLLEVKFEIFSDHDSVQYLFTQIFPSQRILRLCKFLADYNHQRLGTETYSAIPIQPFTSWAKDLIGPMPRSNDGNEWIVTWMDRTSKTIVAAAAAQNIHLQKTWLKGGEHA